MSLRNIAIIILCILTLTGCACTQNSQSKNQVPKFEQLTVANFLKQCDANPTEHYAFPMFGTYYAISKHDTCLDVKGLFVVMWQGPRTDLQETASKYLTVLYAQSMGERFQLNYSYEFLKHASAKENPLHAAFYRLTSVPIKQTEEKTSDEN